jgi:xanthine dehydrogenase YagR molybdenum-binding subunit
MPDYIGQPMNRVDGRLKVTGHATYAAEHKIPNVAHAVMLTSKIAKGKVASMDTRAAERLPGVLAIMTPFNTAKLPPTPTKPGGPADRILQLLQDPNVYYDNQPIAVAVAETLENAVEAAHLIRVTYARQSHNVSLEKAVPSAYVPKKAGPRGDPAETNHGDVKSGLSQATHKVEHIYRTPAETHNPMEPHATIAVWDGPDKLTLYDATQGVFGDKQRVATLLGLQPDNVHVVSPYLGGGFGSKGPVWSHVVLCAMAARKVNRPVKLEVTRPQMFGPIGFRSPTRQSISAGAQADGALTALRNDTITQTSSFDDFVETATFPTRMLHAAANNATAQRVVRLDTGTPSYMRAPGEAPGNYALEAAIDELAYELKMDPLEFRIKNYAEQDPEKNLPWSSKSLRECYHLGAEKFGWSRRTHEPRSMREGNVLVGWGMASSVYPTNRSEAHCLARLHKDGTILVESGTQDIGTGTYTVMTQIAADAIGVSPAQVDFRLGDTDYPQAPVSGGSQTAASVGSAVHLAGQALQEKIVQMAITDPASPVHGATTQSVRIADGHISAGGKSETLAQLMSRHGADYIEAEGDAKPGDEKKHYSMYAFGAQFAEVRVDTDLGQMRVSRMTGVFGAGKILNAKTARSQLMGGMVFAIGMALYEQTVMDQRLGRIVNNNLAEYLVPVNADVPEIEVSCVDEVDHHINPIGVKGVGEIGITGGVAAIANAVFHATGKRVRDLPITLDKLI